MQSWLKDYILGPMGVCAIVAAAGCLSAPTAAAGPDTENGRYTLSPVNGGFLRLDTRSGVVSMCTEKTGGWACYAVPDERAALDSEIGRLQAENSRLKSQIAQSQAPAGQPGAGSPGAENGKGAQSPNRIELPLPSDQDLDRAMAFVEKVWRRLIEMVGRVQKDVSEKL